MTAPIVVVAAVRRDGARYWVCRRTENGRHGGLVGMWEYPGGKVEVGETLEAALAREMREEFGVEIEVGQRLDTITSESCGRMYRVHFFETVFLGEPELRVHSEARWATVAELVMQNHLPSGAIFNGRLAGGISA